MVSRLQFLYTKARARGLRIATRVACLVCAAQFVTCAHPLCAGFSIKGAAERVDLGGRDVTNQLAALLRRAGHTFHTSAERETLRMVKEAVCYVAASPSEAEKSAAALKPCEYVLPDGCRLRVGVEQYAAPEILFQPRLAGAERMGVHEMVGAVLQKSDLELRPTLTQNIVLAGGSTTLRGFGERFFTEMKRSLPMDTRIKITAAANRRQLVWIGGSIVGALSTFKSMCIDQEAWKEHGDSILDRIPSL